jgi:hypothetical protein
MKGVPLEGWQIFKFPYPWLPGVFRHIQPNCSCGKCVIVKLNRHMKGVPLEGWQIFKFPYPWLPECSATYNSLHLTSKDAIFILNFFVNRHFNNNLVVKSCKYNSIDNSNALGKTPYTLS